MSQANHHDCWISASDPPKTTRRIIIWTKKVWLPKGAPLSRHLDTEGAWYWPKKRIWFHSDGTEAKNVTHWMEMPRAPHWAGHPK